MYPLSKDLISYGEGCAVKLMRRNFWPVTTSGKQIAMVGLSKASHAYRGDSESEFRRYAFTCIKNELLRDYVGIRHIIPKKGVRLKRYLSGRIIDVGCISNDISYSCNGIESKLQNKEIIKRLLLSLTDKQRDLINLRFFKGYSVKQISQQKGVSRQSVSYMTRRALDRMRESYNELEYM